MRYRCYCTATVLLLLTDYFLFTYLQVSSDTRDENKGNPSTNSVPKKLGQGNCMSMYRYVPVCATVRELLMPTSTRYLFTPMHATVRETA